MDKFVDRKLKPLIINKNNFSRWRKSLLHKPKKSTELKQESPVRIIPNAVAVLFRDKRNVERCIAFINNIYIGFKSSVPGMGNPYVMRSDGHIG